MINKNEKLSYYDILVRLSSMMDIYKDFKAIDASYVLSCVSGLSKSHTINDIRQLRQIGIHELKHRQENWNAKTHQH